MQQSFAPGMRLLIRDAEWMVQKVDSTLTGTQALSVIGISEIVRDKEAIFISDLEKSIELLRPEDTNLIQDDSDRYRKSLVYIESLLRKTPPTDDRLYIGPKAAMDVLPFQLEPAMKALAQPRPRILIADTTGLGKTLECGILLSELIKRGKGKRILVVAIKSMLTQFQKEMWTRFTIPLTRLDSLGIQKVRRKIPTNHNPFFYYDKAIISVDTLKSNEYRVHLEKAHWDVIVIDEAQHLADRGKGSQRAGLRKLLEGRSEAMIMLSATPHDGSAQSFSSLMKTLDPTAIANPKKYAREDIKGLFIRRFKKDVRDQVKGAMIERDLRKNVGVASEKEEIAYNLISEIKFDKIDQKTQKGQQLFRTTLEKSILSSPTACAETVEARIRRLKNKDEAGYQNDINQLEELGNICKSIDAKNFGKYQALLELIKGQSEGQFNWTGKEKDDRIVIFTERIATMNFLEEQLTKDLKLKEGALKTMSGGNDIVLQEIVEEFGKEDSKLRILVATDVAAEGINLHFLCNQMVHFDIPWSLMTLQQRNGRIDRYGQERQPQIRYVVTESANEKFKGDARILELLIEKEAEAEKNIGDPAEIMRLYDSEAEEAFVASQIERGVSKEQALQEWGENSNKVKDEEEFDPMALLSGGSQEPKVVIEQGEVPSIFKKDYEYAEAALKLVKEQSSETIQVDFDPDAQRIDLTAPESLMDRLNDIPNEALKDDHRLHLVADSEKIKREIKLCRAEDQAWPQLHYLWSLNPILGWLEDKVISQFRRNEAPVIQFPKGLMEPGEVIYLMYGVVPNRNGQPLVHPWFGVQYIKGKFSKILEFKDILERLKLGAQPIPNDGREIAEVRLRENLPDAVKRAEEYALKKRDLVDERINVKLNESLSRLEELKSRHKDFQLSLFEGCDLSEHMEEKKKQKENEVEKLFKDFFDWTERSMTLERHAYIKVVAVLDGGVE